MFARLICRNLLKSAKGKGLPGIAHLLPIPRRYNSTCPNKYVTVLECRANDGVQEIILDDAKTRNSLSMGMMDAILEALRSDLADKKLRCIVLSAKGNVWSAGHNLKELVAKQNEQAGREEQRRIFQRLTDIILCIRTAPVPVIAKVNGLAAAAGCQLVASCDIIVATESSQFSTPGANFGVFCSTPGIAISRVMSRSNSAYMLMTGLPLTAQEAYQAGLVSRVVQEEGHLNEEVDKISQAIKAKSRAIIALGKEFFYRQLQLPIEEAYKLGAEKMAENLQMPDSKEGLGSFAEKRKPKWRHE